jgi:hypothetical protein
MLSRIAWWSDALHLKANCKDAGTILVAGRLAGWLCWPAGLAGWLAGLAGWLVGGPAGWLGWLAVMAAGLGWLAGRLVGWLVGWLPGWLAGWPSTLWLEINVFCIYKMYKCLVSTLFEISHGLLAGWLASWLAGSSPLGKSRDN